MTPERSNEEWLHEQNTVAFFDWQGKLVVPNEGLVVSLGANGFRFLDPDSCVVPNYVISNRHTKYNWQMIKKWKVPTSRRTLVVTESRVVDPLPFSQLLRKRYGAVFYSSHQSPAHTQLFGWPWIDGVTTPLSSGIRLPRVVTIQANKFSAIRNEHYSLRRRVLRALHDYGVPSDLYGSWWGNSLLQNLLSSLRADYYRLRNSIAAKEYIPASKGRYSFLNTRRLPSLGEISNKYEILSRYRYSLVIENDPDFFTEKLMDSLASGCITFYLGPESLVDQSWPGLVLLPTDINELLVTIQRTLSQPDSSLPTCNEIRSAAIQTFFQPQSWTWERLGQLWLEYVDVKGKC